MVKRCLTILWERRLSQSRKKRGKRNRRLKKSSNGMEVDEEGGNGKGKDGNGKDGDDEKKSDDSDNQDMF